MFYRVIACSGKTALETIREVEALSAESERFGRLLSNRLGTRARKQQRLRMFRGVAGKVSGQFEYNAEGRKSLDSTIHFGKL
jgi:hypothetical protein